MKKIELTIITHARLKVLCCLFTLFVIVVIVSCGTNNSVNPTVTNTKINIVNVSSDVYLLDTYITNIRFNSALRHPGTTGYIGINTGPQTLQLRTTYNNIILFNVGQTFVSNTNYTLFLTGYNNPVFTTDSIAYVFTTDTASLPTIGRGKVRFVNVAPRTAGLDVYANSVLAFNNRAYKSVSGYTEFPAGTYDFKINVHGSATSSLLDVPNIAIQDGRLYTLYSFGLVGARDSTAFGTSVITNK